MPDITFTTQRFPAGTSVSAYPKSSWPRSVTWPTGSPLGAATATATVSASSTLVLTGLAAETDYFLHGSVGGEDRYVAFSTRTGPETPAGLAARMLSVESTRVEASAEGVLPGLANVGPQLEAAAAKAVAAGVWLHIRGDALPYNIGAISIPGTLKLVMDDDCVLKRVTGVTGTLIECSSAANGLRVIGGRVDNDNVTDMVFSSTFGADDVVFDGFKATNFRAAPLVFSTGGVNKNVTIKHCRFIGVAGLSNVGAVAVNNPLNLRVLYNHFEDSGGFGSYTGGAGIARGIWVIGNRFVRVNASNILIRPADTATLEDVVVAHNVAEEAGTPLGKGLVVVGEQVLGTAGSTTTRRVTVVNNIVKYFAGIGISIGGGVTPGVVEDVVVAGNHVDGAVGTTVDAASSSVGILFNGVTSFKAYGNRVTRVGRSGIRLASSVSGTVAGNNVSDCARGTGYTDPTPADEHGIGIFAGCSKIVIEGNLVRSSGVDLANINAGIGAVRASTVADITVQGNRCYDDRGTPKQAFGVRIGSGGLDAEQPTDWTVFNNSLAGNATGAILMYNTTSKNHRMSGNGGVATPTATAAATITLPPESDTIRVSGAGTITTLNGGWVGRCVTLVMLSSATLATGGNIDLGLYKGESGQAITLVYDGISALWREIARKSHVYKIGPDTATAMNVTLVSGDAASLGRMYEVGTGTRVYGPGNANTHDVSTERSAAGRFRINGQGQGTDGLITKDLGDIAGLTSAQIDALFTYAPLNGCLASGLDGLTAIHLERRAGKWHKSLAYTQIA